MPSLYVTRPGSRIELERGRLLTILGEELLASVPAARVDRVFAVGGVSVTTPVMAFLLDRGIDLVFLTLDGRVRGRLDAGLGGSLVTRRGQYRRADDPAFSLTLAKAFVTGKARNCRTRCLKLAEGEDGPAAEAAGRIARELPRIEAAADHATLMGTEGRIARAYYAGLRAHLRSPWRFERRARRPPPDPVNAVLSITYTLLVEQCRTALTAAGLDPECGFLHAARAGRPALALDLMEEFRPVIADAVTWALFNNRMLDPGQFVTLSDGAVRLSPESWKDLAGQYSRRIETPILVPGRSTRTTYRKLLEVQAWQIRRVIEGAQEAYAPFLSR